MNGYNSFAEFYDLLQSEGENPVNYPALGEYIDKLFSKFSNQKGILLDLACGTGELSMVMSSLSYDVIGTDNSPEMLSVASSKPHDGIQYLCQDMRNIDMYGTIDFCVCALDGINHLLKSNEVQSAFNGVSLFMNSGGLFCFDVNTVRKHKEILAYNTFIYDLPPLYCAWQNYYLGNGLLNIYLDFFIKDNDGHYIRQTDIFSQKAYPLNKIAEMLKKSGFELLSVLDWLTMNEGTENSDKVVFLARKI